MKGVNTVHSFTGMLTLGAVLGGLRIGDMVVMLVFFLLLLVLLRKFAWGPLMGIMEERETFVANEIEVAEKNRKEAEIASAEATKQLNQTREETQQMIEEARETAVEQEKNIIAVARKEATRLKQVAEADIENEKDKAVQALQDKVASLSVLIASKVIEKEINAQDQEELIGEFIKEVGDDK